MDTGLVGEGAETGDVIVADYQRGQCADMYSQRYLDLNSFGDEVLNLTEHGKVVLGLDVRGVCNHHAGDETTKGCNTVTLSDTELSSALCVLNNYLQQRCQCEWHRPREPRKRWR